MERLHQFGRWTMVWLSGHWAWIRFRYCRYRYLIDWWIDWLHSILNTLKRGWSLLHKSYSGSEIGGTLLINENILFPTETCRLLSTVIHRRLTDVETCCPRKHGTLPLETCHATHQTHHQPSTHVMFPTKALGYEIVWVVWRVLCYWSSIYFHSRNHPVSQQR